MIDVSITDRAASHPTTAAWRRSWTSLATAALVAVATVLAYGPSLPGDFLFDDLSEIVANPAIRTLWPPWRPMFEGGELPHRPLPYLSFALNHALGGLEPLGYRIVNLAIHLLNGWLLWSVVVMTLRSRGERDSRAIAWISALLWLVHPIQSQAVAYVYQRIELLAATAALATLAAFVAAADATGRRRSFFQTASVTACAAGMACKEWMVVVPLVLVLYDVLLMTGSWRATLVARWRLHAALCATWGILAGIIRSQRRFYPEFAVEGPAPGVGPSRRLLYFLNQPAVILWYLSLVVAPVGQSLDHGTPLREAWWLAGPLVLAMAACGALVAAAGRAPGTRFLGITFFLLLAPTSSLLPVHDVCVEHRMYLPSAVVAIAVAHGLVAAAGARLAGIAAVCLALMLAAVTFSRARVYAAPLAAWTDAVAKSPTSSRARSRLATELSRLDRHAEAIAMAEEGVALQPGNVVGYAALAAVLLNAGRPAEAAEAAERGLDLESARRSSGEGWRNPVAARLSLYRGVALDRRGDPQGLPLIEAAVRGSPDSLDALEYLARALAPVEPRRSAALFGRLVTIEPQNARLRYDLGCVLIGVDTAAAEREFRAAIRLDPNNAEAHNNLAGILAARGRLEEAISAYRDCLEINPTHPLAGPNLQAAEAALRKDAGG